MDEFWASVRQFFHDRVASPALRTFTIAWLIINYRLIFTLFGGGPYQDKFEYISTAIYPHWWSHLLFGFALPVAAAAALIYAFPWVDLRVYRKWLGSQIELRRARTAAEDETPVPQHEAFQLKGRNVELETEVSELKDQLANAQAYAADLETRIPDNPPYSLSAVGPEPVSNPDAEALTRFAKLGNIFAEPGMSDAAKIVLMKIVEAHPHTLPRNVILESSIEQGLSSVRADFVLEQLENKKYVEVVPFELWEDIDHPEIALTSEGKALCIKLELI